jgi:cytochrome c551/c552
LEVVLKNICIAILLTSVLMTTLTGCGDNERQPKPNVAAEPQTVISPAAQIATSPPSPASAANIEANNNSEVGMPAAAKRYNCTVCHAINKKVVGPAWMNVSLKYKGAEKFEYNGKVFPLVEGLMLKVSLGGSGNWGSMPMPANDSNGIKQTEVKELVLFILGLAK